MHLPFGVTWYFVELSKVSPPSLSFIYLFSIPGLWSFRRLPSDHFLGLWLSWLLTIWMLTHLARIWGQMIPVPERPTAFVPWWVLMSERGWCYLCCLWPWHLMWYVHLCVRSLTLPFCSPHIPLCIDLLGFLYIRLVTGFGFVSLVPILGSEYQFPYSSIPCIDLTKWVPPE
jgi:hypothetical protein